MTPIKKRRVLILAPYPAGKSPSQRYRFEHYLDKLEANNIYYTYRSFLSENAWSFFFKPGHTGKKIVAIISGFVRRWLQMFAIAPYDYVFIHREVAPVGPPVFEWIISKIYRKKIIYDFDDAIWIPSVSSVNKIALRFKWFSKIAAICKMSQTVTTGNSFLGSFASQYCKSVVVIPTVVNTDTVHNQLQNHKVVRPTVGWTGTLTTLKYLGIVLPVLQKLQEEIDFNVVVISNSDPQLPLKNYRYIQWSSKTEATDLLSMHIGLMPLFDGDLEKGKCGFKAIQYMSLGIPAVVSPVGVNTEIVEDGVNGFICDNEKSWEEKIRILLSDADLREKMGREARRKIETSYSVNATAAQFISLFSR